MERRKFVIGAGALATGSAAAMGTGAFSNATVERTVTVDTVGDDAAVVGIEGLQGGEYVDETGDQLEVTLDELNEQADFTFEDVFKIENNGSETVRLDRINENAWYNITDNGYNVLVANDVNELQEDVGRYTFVSGAEEPELGPGDSIAIGFGFFGGGGGVGDFGSDGNQDITDAPETLTFNLGG